MPNSTNNQPENNAALTKSTWAHENRWFIVFIVVALLVGAILPFAGVPTLATVLISASSTSLATLSLPAVAAVNATLFAMTALLLRGLDFVFNAAGERVARLSQQADSQKKKKNAEGKVYTSLIFRMLEGPVFSKAAFILDAIERNPIKITASIFAFVIGAATTFTSAHGFLGLVSATTLAATPPILVFFLNGLIPICCAAIMYGTYLALRSDDKGDGGSPDSTEETTAPLTTRLSTIPCFIQESNRYITKYYSSRLFEEAEDQNREHSQAGGRV